MTRLRVSNHGRIQVSMIQWLIEHVGPGDSQKFHGDEWDNMKRHQGEDGMYTQAQGRGWEIIYMSDYFVRDSNDNLVIGSDRKLVCRPRGTYVDIEDEEKAVLFALSWL